MADQQPSRLKRVNFRCLGKECGHRFEAVPDRIEPDESQDFHPWQYFAKCPVCGAEAPQVHWERSLLKAHARATGPKTPEGLAAVTKNLEGHPTAEEAQRTRFNAMKHGLYAKVTRYYPARPGKYQACEGCRYLDNGCGVETNVCLARVEIFMAHEIAYEQNNPAVLRELNMEMQAAVRAIVNEMLLSITRRGVEWETPEWYYDKDGKFHLAKWEDNEGKPHQLMKVEQHPLLKTLIDLMKANGMTLPDQGMTPRSSEQQDELKGYLSDQADDREQLLDYQARQTKALENLQGMIESSRRATANDPILLEHGQQDISDAEFREVGDS